MGMKKNKKNESGKKAQSTEDDLTDQDTVVEDGKEDPSSGKEHEIAELKDKYLRLFAEFDNYKKRTARERLDLIRHASEDIMVGLLPVLDDFDRAKKNADSEDSGESFSEGVQLVYHKLKQVLQQKGLKEMDTAETEFDPELHEAITKIPAPSEELKGKIIDHIEKGYYLNDKIIRHAKVVIGE
jgi:molecular chaperone GrpE